jgi:transcriptional regulator of acetoin/glycerol metabolism
VSAISPELSERAHALTGALTVTAARDIEERFFREHFLQEWIIALALTEDGDPAVLLAVDGNQSILGASRAARATSVERCRLRSIEFPVVLLRSQNRMTERRLSRANYVAGCVSKI